MKKSKRRINMKSKKISEIFKKQVLLIFTCIFYFSTIRAQEAITASGGDASGSGGAASYSIGQVVYYTHSGTSGSEAQGVQQPYEISEVTGIADGKSITLQCTASPNPVTEKLVLKIEGELQTQYFASLYDIKGIRLEYKKINDTETIFDMSSLLPATYILKVINNNKEVRTFKILKNQ
jgi:hypothetical protein